MNRRIEMICGPAASPVAIAFLALATSCSKTPLTRGVQAAATRVESTITTINSGTVDAEQQAVLGFSSAGRVESVSARVGDRVSKGQLIAALENADLKTILEDSEAELKRTQELFQSGLVSRVALDQAKKGFEVARANYDRSVIRAPFEGILTELNLVQGELASTAAPSGKAPVRIVDLKPRIIRGNIDELDLAKVKVGQMARVKILAVSPERLPARVTRVIPYVNSTKEQDRTSAIELKLDGPSAKVPVGASADVEIVVASKDSVLAVPSRAVLGVGEGKHSYVLSGGKAEKRSVRVGLGNHERLEILQGLAVGEVVLLPSESVELKDGLKVKAEIQPWP